jgi:cytochrome b involved in lipid metabolism
VDLITGLPWHPLIIHGVVVLVPLAALGVLLVMFIPKIRRTYSPLVLGTLYVSTIFAFLATQSGEALAERVGLPNPHATQGQRLLYVVVAFSALFTIWFVLEYSDRIRKAVPSAIKPVLNVVIPITAIASIVLTVLVGHSGATASWKSRIAQTQGTVLEPTTPAPTNSTKPADPNTPTTPTQPAKPTTPTGSINLSAAEIATHNSRSDCWSIVRDNVYNLTSYVQKHPGGASVIANICGKDGSGAFTNQHNSQSKPNNVLSGFLLGAVDSTISSGVAQKVIAAPTGVSTNESDEESDDD